MDVLSPPADITDIKQWRAQTLHASDVIIEPLLSELKTESGNEILLENKLLDEAPLREELDIISDRPEGLQDSSSERKEAKEIMLVDVQAEEEIPPLENDETIKSMKSTTVTSPDNKPDTVLNGTFDEMKLSPSDSLKENRDAEITGITQPLQDIAINELNNISRELASHTGPTDVLERPANCKTLTSIGKYPINSKVSAVQELQSIGPRFQPLTIDDINVTVKGDEYDVTVKACIPDKLADVTVKACKPDKLADVTVKACKPDKLADLTVKACKPDKLAGVQARKPDKLIDEKFQVHKSDKMADLTDQTRKPEKHADVTVTARDTDKLDDVKVEPPKIDTQVDVKVQVCETNKLVDVKDEPTERDGLADVKVESHKPHQVADVKVEPTKPDKLAAVKVQPRKPDNPGHVKVQPRKQTKRADAAPGENKKSKEMSYYAKVRKVVDANQSILKLVTPSEFDVYMANLICNMKPSTRMASKESTRKYISDFDRAKKHETTPHQIYLETLWRQEQLKQKEAQLKAANTRTVIKPKNVGFYLQSFRVIGYLTTISIEMLGLTNLIIKPEGTIY